MRGGRRCSGGWLRGRAVRGRLEEGVRRARREAVRLTERVQLEGALVVGGRGRRVVIVGEAAATAAAAGEVCQPRYRAVGVGAVRVGMRVVLCMDGEVMGLRAANVQLETVHCLTGLVLFFFCGTHRFLFFLFNFLRIYK
ncbi:hypothetical protein STCU_10135 [Strigomonas culicis]|uniref:Uncharacterized protein n=1 Tax=Strigomonas culicis TaxID=28005 RepID=S9TJD3_9TRYP|nr:hypothetical protein STCU_10135 [Strigomonas culicis]|eukprot:EPY18177.1 hypothetical protein STCU_10135 [Strigomonas culicis]